MKVPQSVVRRLYFLVFPALASLAAFIGSFELVERIDFLNSLFVSDLEHQEAQRTRAKPDPAIRVILVKPETPAKLGLPPDVVSVPRRKYAEMLTALDAAGARAALVDVQFIGKKQDDDQVNQALRRLASLRVTLATSCRPEDSAKQTPEGMMCDFAPIAFAPKVPSDNLGTGSIFALQDSSKRLVGFIPHQLDMPTGHLVWPAPVIAVLQYFRLSPDRLEVTNDSLTAGAMHWNLSSTQMILRPTKTIDPFPTYEFSDAIHRCEGPRHGEEFKDSLVIIGVDFPYIDRHDVAGLGSISGTLYLAQMTNTVLLGASGEHSEVSLALVFAWTFAMGFATFRAVCWMRPRGILLSMGLLAATAVPSWISSSVLGAMFPFFQPGLSVALCLLSALVLVNVLPPPTAGTVQARSTDATVMFLDLVNSTALMNQVGSVRFQALLSHLHRDFHRIVDRSGGLIERTAGDGFLAIFHAGRGRHHAVRAAEASLEALRAVSEAARKESLPLRASIGFETGPVGGGYLTEGGRRTWSSSGPTVHMAQRLQEIVRRFDQSIAVGPVARRYVQEEFECSVLGSAEAKGFPESIEVSTLNASRHPNADSVS